MPIIPFCPSSSQNPSRIKRKKKKLGNGCHQPKEIQKTSKSSIGIIIVKKNKNSLRNARKYKVKEIKKKKGRGEYSKTGR